MGGRVPASALVRFVDRWIFVLMAAWFVVITLTGFIPTSLEKIAASQAGMRPPFPFMLHAHAVLMGAFILLLLAQAILVATGRQQHHQKLGMAGIVIAPALVVVGCLLVPIIHHQVWGMTQAAPPEAQAELQQVMVIIRNIMLLQIQVGALFAIYIGIALYLRKSDPGMHKRLIFLAVALPLPAAFDRIAWLPNTMPETPLGPILYILLAVAPMFIWDLLRTRKVHKAYSLWLAGFLPSSVLIYLLWNSDWWQATAPRLVGL
ncbi:MAG: hypothetical protein CMP07_10860 [Xanthomonadales bacterium]|nr:hypothetical protein [Xanthomonadales bacterium]